MNALRLVVLAILVLSFSGCRKSSNTYCTILGMSALGEAATKAGEDK